MKHVFVETNFIIEVARPFPSPDVERLLERSLPGGDVALHIPWVAIGEAKRTLDRIIREDLGFTDTMLKFAVRTLRDGTLTIAQKQVVDEVARQAKEARAAAIKMAGTNVDAIAGRTSIIEPDKEVVTKTLSLFAVKSLKPFDEMILGAVLSRAAALHQGGERDLWFCNSNKKDFDPANQPALAQEYDARGINYRSTFVVP